jgi:hypothetical protein
VAAADSTRGTLPRMTHDGDAVDANSIGLVGPVVGACGRAWTATVCDWVRAKRSTPRRPSGMRRKQ